MRGLRARGTAWSLACALACSPALVGAQNAAAHDDHSAHDEQPVSVGGELSAAVGPADDTAYFNYTNYDRNNLRVFRIRLFGEWRALPRLSLVGEIRSEDAADVSAAALYARWRPSATRGWLVQAGRIPPLLGAFGRRAYGRDNPVFGIPLGYQYLTSLRPDAVPASVTDLIRMRGRGWEPIYPIGALTTATGVSLLSVSNWDTGAEVLWEHGPVEVGGALSRGSPAVPVVRETNDGLMWSGRASVRLGSLLVGTSAGSGQWLSNDVLDLLPHRRDTPSSQHVVAADAEWGEGPWLVRGEWLRSTFDVPLVASVTPEITLRAWTAFAEARYRPRPRWQLGVRGERLSFGSIAGDTGAPIAWDAPVTRLEGTLGFRINRQLEIRGGWQQNWRDGGRVLRRGYPAVGAILWF
jgi:hypothetical protein